MFCHSCLITIFGTKIGFKRPYVLLCGSMALQEQKRFMKSLLRQYFHFNKKPYEELLNNLETILQILHAANLKANIEKNTFATTLFEYLGYHILTSRVWPLTSKVEAIQQLNLPKTLKQLRSLLEIINYYRNKWKEVTITYIFPYFKKFF
jgi:uncharacterized protein YjgD (DUF1641 family)